MFSLILIHFFAGERCFGIRCIIYWFQVEMRNPSSRGSHSILPFAPSFQVQAVERQLQEPSEPSDSGHVFRCYFLFLDLCEETYVSCDVAWSCMLHSGVLWTLIYVLQSSVFVTAGSDGGEKATCRESATCFIARARHGQVGTGAKW